MCNPRNLTDRIKLMTTLNSWREWHRRDCPKYGHDNYYNRISPGPAANEYEFDIQTFDSPDGDRWWTGRFRLINGGTDIVILGSSVYQR